MLVNSFLSNFGHIPIGLISFSALNFVYEGVLIIFFLAASKDSVVLTFDFNGLLPLFNGLSNILDVDEF